SRPTTAADTARPPRHAGRQASASAPGAQEPPHSVPANEPRARPCPRRGAQPVGGRAPEPRGASAHAASPSSREPMTLRARLLAYGLGVAAVAIAVVALLVARGTRREVDRFVLSEAIVERAPGRAAGVAEALDRDLRSGATLAQAVAALSAQEPATR